VSKPSKPKRKTPSRSKPAGGTRAPRKTVTAKRPSTAKPRATASAKSTKTPARKPRRKTNRFLAPPPPLPLEARDDRGVFAVLLVPFVLLVVAVSASQLYTPLDSARSQFALLPEPVMVPASKAVSLDAPPRPRLAASGEAPDTVRSPENAEPADAIVRIASLRPQPPRETVAAKPEWLVRADKCEVPAKRKTRMQSTPVAFDNAAAFGRMLARAARAQTEELVIYTDRYQQIGFPMGDVPSMYGVCTDVVIRAYRALGIDLQVLVHKARIGTGDTSIDHRRTKTLRRFFARHGESLPVTDFPEDYRPGDIVTYYRASGRSSQSHIAIVSDVIAPSGRPMIVHNRGWGPQLEDALFASDVTGHYRFTNTALPDDDAAQEAKLHPVSKRIAQTPSSTDANLR
jgi:uncharacterized protein YijF (DUF1287 family)